MLNIISIKVITALLWLFCI